MKKISELIMNTEAYIAAAAMNYDGAQSIVREMQNSWDDGSSFTGTGMDAMFAERSDDREEEAAACVAEAEKSLRWLAIREKIAGLSEQEALILESSLRSMNAKLNMYGETILADSIRSIRAEQ